MIEGGPSAESGQGGSGAGPEGGEEQTQKRSVWGWVILAGIVVLLVMGQWTWLVALIGLAFLITVHEFGHFIFAKKLGMRVERFYVGFPPAIWRRQRGETEYGIGMIPLGGFCKISGMSQDEELPLEAEPRAYYNQPVWKRNLVIFAGPLMNIVVAPLILFVFLLAQGTVTATLTLDEVVEDAPAAEAGLEPGDTLVAGRVVADDGTSGEWVTFETWDEASAFLAANPDTEVELRYVPGSTAGSTTAGESAEEDGAAARDGPVETVTVTLARNPDDDSLGFLGVRAGQTSERPAPWTALWLGIKGTGDIVVATFQGFWMLLSGEIDAIGPNGAAGPIGIVDVSSRAVQQGFYPALMALISINLAIINLVPILPFDGGHILLNTLESIRRRKVSPRFMERFAAVGVVLVLALFLYLTFGDIRRLLG